MDIDFNELLKPTEVQIIDLMSYIPHIDEDPYFVALFDPTPGVYLPGAIDPILSWVNPAYPASKFGVSMAAITGLQGLKECKEPLVNSKGVTICTAAELKKAIKHMTDTPTLPVNMLKVMLAILNTHLTTMCVKTRTRISSSSYQHLVRPEYQHLIEDDSYVIALDQLLLDINQFIRNDTFHIYFTKLLGTSVIIEKTIDYRIYEWYQYKAKEKNLGRTDEF